MRNEPRNWLTNKINVNWFFFFYFCRIKVLVMNMLGIERSSEFPFDFRYFTCEFFGLPENMDQFNLNKK